jgi:molybdopterin converting factor small subunit
VADKITVSVTLRSILSKYRPNPKDRTPFAVELDAGATVADVLAARGVPPKIAHLVFVDRVRRDHDTVLHNGASLDIYPPIAGG